MRTVTVVVLLSFIAFATGYVTAGNKLKYADKAFLQKQKTILELLRHVNQPEIHPKYYQDALAYKIEDNYDQYTNVEAVKEFVKYYNYSLLEKDEIFSIFDQKQRDYAVSLFHVLYYAKTWDTFYRSMVWANLNCNRGMFIYALTVAVVHRPDMVGMELPAPYELYPYYFFNSDVIQKAQIAKMHGFAGMKKVQGVYNVVVRSNYSSDYIYINDDQKVSYFTEDIGLNSYYYYFHTDYPFWMGGKEYNLNKDRRGELYLFQHQQLLARYYLERLSNNLGEIPELSYYHPVKTGYYPNLRYYNGMFFPARDNSFNYYNEYNYYDVSQIEDYERRIRDAIDAGYVQLPDGTQIDLSEPKSVEQLGNMIQGNPDMPNRQYFKYIAVYARLLLGSTIEHYDQPKVMPSVLEHFETSMRDPLFYMLYKRLIQYYWQFKNHLEPYTRDQLQFTGVKITNAEVDKLVTYFDYYDSDITNAVDVAVQPAQYSAQPAQYSAQPTQYPIQTGQTAQSPMGHFGIGQGGYSQTNWVPGSANSYNIDWSESGYEGIPKINPAWASQQQVGGAPSKLQPQYQYTGQQLNSGWAGQEQIELSPSSQYQSQYQPAPQQIKSGYGIQQEVPSSQYQSQFQYPEQQINAGLNAQSQLGVTPSTYKEDFVIKARQKRLNHLPFTVKLNVFSDKPNKAVVRAYLGPKYDEKGNMLAVNENRENFWVLDIFPVDLIPGDNLVVRNSRNFTWFIKDRTPYSELYNWVQGSFLGETKFPLDMTEAHCGFPQRLMIPKGKKTGQAYQLFFIVTPYVAPEIPQGSNYNNILNCGVGSGARYLDDLPMGYPFDRTIDDSMWYTPNMYYYDAMIFNRKETDVYSQY